MNKTTLAARRAVEKTLRGMLTDLQQYNSTVAALVVYIADDIASIIVEDKLENYIADASGKTLDDAYVFLTHRLADTEPPPF